MGTQALLGKVNLDRLGNHEGQTTPHSCPARGEAAAATPQRGAGLAGMTQAPTPPCRGPGSLLLHTRCHAISCRCRDRSLQRLLLLGWGCVVCACRIPSLGFRTQEGHLPPSDSVPGTHTWGVSISVALRLCAEEPWVTGRIGQEGKGQVFLFPQISSP